MQPSVIWIGEAEKMFYKKVPKEEKEVKKCNPIVDLSSVEMTCNDLFPWFSFWYTVRS